MLQGLAKYTDRIDRPGLLKIHYAPIHLIDLENSSQVINDDGIWLSPISFLSGDWLEMKIIPKDDAWQDTLNKSIQGESFEQSIRGFIPGLRKEASRETRQMANMRFIVKLTDKNNQTWLIGSLERGLDFNFTKDSGTSDGKNGLPISFNGVQRFEAPIYGPG